MRKSIDQGLTEESSFAFAACAFALCGLNNHSLASYCGKVAEYLVRVSNQKNGHIVVPSLNLSILAFRQPLQACIENFRHAYQEAMTVGDIDWGTIALFQVTNLGIFAPQRGKSLADVEKEYRSNIQEISMYNQKPFAAYCANLNELLFNLVSTSNTGTATLSPPVPVFTEEQDSVVSMYLAKKMLNGLRKVYANRMLIGYLFRDYRLAAEMASKHQDVSSRSMFVAPIENILESFTLALVAHALVRRGDNAERWSNVAAEATATVSKWAEEDSEWNFRHKADLLKAEAAYNLGDNDAAIKLYEAAIAGAGEHCFINEQGLASERFGLFYRAIGDEANARRYFEEAEGYYRTYGATRKADDVHLALLS